MKKKNTVSPQLLKPSPFKSWPPVTSYPGHLSKCLSAASSLSKRTFDRTVKHPQFLFGSFVTLSGVLAALSSTPSPQCDFQESTRRRRGSSWTAWPTMPRCLHTTFPFAHFNTPLGLRQKVVGCYGILSHVCVIRSL